MRLRLVEVKVWGRIKERHSPTLASDISRRTKRLELVHRRHQGFFEYPSSFHGLGLHQNIQNKVPNVPYQET